MPVRCVLWSRMERNRLGSTRDVDARASIEMVIAFLERPKPARCCRGVKKRQVGDFDEQILELSPLIAQAFDDHEAFSATLRKSQRFSPSFPKAITQFVSMPVDKYTYVSVCCFA
jgi:hypothetical protein